VSLNQPQSAPLAPVPPGPGAVQRLSQAFALGGLVSLAISGCVSFLPLPLSPISILSKEFPPRIPGAGGTNGDYTINNDVFAYPQLNLSVTRPNGIDWGFFPRNGFLIVQLRNNLSGTEPAPSLLVEPLGVPKDIPGALVSELSDLQKKNDQQSAAWRTINGVVSEAWTIYEPDAKTGLVAKKLRIYVALPTMFAILESVADQGTFATYAPAFTSMLTNIKLPTAPAGTPPVAPGLSPLVAPGVKGESYTDAASGVTLTRANANWFFGLAGANGALPILALRRAGVAAGLDPFPQLNLTALKAAGVNLAKQKQTQRAALDTAKVPVTVVSRQINGFNAEQWTFDIPDILGKPATTRRIYVQNSAAVVILEATAIKSDFATVEAELDQMITSLVLPTGTAVADGTATATPAATPAATPGATSAATPAATRAASPLRF
jgi:hypothetical protein